ncbi:MAG: low molecular weight phosphotyrosine protein phosphatase [Bacteroidetes bacterium]|nr:low molecular weight phosphotyrosine protein phosphatase [Bacteroidota bacterium]
MKILMVCLGNICRSPLAEGILSDITKNKDLDWEVDSAGTGSWHVGQSPDERSVAIARKYGLDISHQRARQFHYPDFENFDIIYAMDSSNYNDIRRLAVDDNERDKVRLILNESAPGRNGNVPDPYWDDDGFDKVYHMLKQACEMVVENYA